jgi:hypothetical protein
MQKETQTQVQPAKLRVQVVPKEEKKLQPPAREMARPQVEHLSLMEQPEHKMPRS